MKFWSYIIVVRNRIAITIYKFDTTSMLKLNVSLQNYSLKLNSD